MWDGRDFIFYRCDYDWGVNFAVEVLFPFHKYEWFLFLPGTSRLSCLAAPFPLSLGLSSKYSQLSALEGTLLFINAFLITIVASTFSTFFVQPTIS